MLTTLVLVFCLAGDPTHCQRIEPQADEDMYRHGGLGECFLAGERLESLWLAEHPKWQFGHVECTPGYKPRSQQA